MKSKQIIISALMLVAAMVAAQTSNKPATVRLKKIVIVDGVEKITDTTFTTDNPGALNLGDDKVHIEEVKDANGTIHKIVSIDGEQTVTDKDGKTVRKMLDIDSRPGKDGDPTVIIINKGDKMTPDDEEKLMKMPKGTTPLFIITDKDKSGQQETGEAQQVIIKTVRCGARPGEIDSVKEITSVYICKKATIVNANDDELKQLGKQTGISDNKLAVDKMNFYPNPSNGKFNLAFSLPKKGTTEVTVLNLEGKTIYNEKLANFSGTYDKEIDISQSPKGVYFVKIAQGPNSQIKKIVLE